MTQPQPQFVPIVVDDPAPSEQSWDAFWAERKPTRTETIRGVQIRVPTGLTLAYREESRRRLNETGAAGFAPLAVELFRAPDGTRIPDLWQRWLDAGMELDELEAVIAWGIAHGVGQPITFAEAADRIDAVVAARREGREADEGKAQAARTPKSGSTGAPSKPASKPRTASARTRSHS